MKFRVAVLFALPLLFIACKPKPKNIPPVQRKEAATLVSEAQFAMTIRDFARAEPLLEKAAKLSPDTGDYWLNLGVVRRRLDNKSGAKSAFESALHAFQDAYKIDAKQSDALLKQIYVLALLGRPDEARRTLEKARKHAPDDPAIRTFAERNELDQLMQDPSFKEVAL
jgi:tetratricopeptide (TPR) repeat protein